MNIKYLLLIAAALTFTQTAVAQSRINNERGTGKSTQTTKPAGSKKYVCEAAKQDLANLNSMATQLNSSSVQDLVKERKAAVQKVLYEWEC